MANYDKPSRSWFVVFNNPEEIITYKRDSSGEYVLDSNNDKIIESSISSDLAGKTPEEICDACLKLWVGDSETRTGACSYCISAKGLHHLHMVLEEAAPVRFSKVKAVFPRAHLEPTRGTKAEAENYINKLGVWGEKGEQIVCIKYHGEIKGRQGQRSDLETVEQMLNDGIHPNDILLKSLKYEKYDSMIKQHYFRIKKENAPIEREVKVYWHVGPSGCGKTHVLHELSEQYKNDLYLVSNYTTGYLDDYIGESVLFLDEFRGQIPFATLLTMLQGYTSRFHARYHNVVGLWTEVHITSVFPPERLYKKMVDATDQDIDTIEQLKRRITGIFYHWRDKEENYCKYYCGMSDYISYQRLVLDALGYFPETFRTIEKDEEKFIQEVLRW